MDVFGKMTGMAALTFSMLLAQSAMAQKTFQDNILWSDLKGLQKAENCTPVLLQSIPFFISEGADVEGKAVTIQLADNTTKRISARSFVQILDKPEIHHTKSVKVIGANQTNRNKNSAVRDEEGAVAENQLQVVDDYVLEIQKSEDDKKLKNNFFDLSNTLWQVAKSKENYLSLACEKGSQIKYFVLFNAFNKGSDQAVAQVGVSANDTAIFKNIKVFSADEIGRTQVNLGAKAEAPGASKKPQVITKGAYSAILDSARKAFNSVVVDKSNDVAPPTKISTETNSGVVVKVQIPLLVKPTVSREDLKISEVNAETPKDTGTGTVLDYLVCTSDSGLSIREETTDEYLFTAQQFEAVQIVQTWEGNKDKSKIQVQFPNRNNQKGFAAAAYIKLKKDCVPYTEAQHTKTVDSTNISGGGINSPDCCVFPTIKRPTASYKEDQRRFRAGRGGSKKPRQHAACDLYRKHGEIAVAITSGKFVRPLYFFYQGTFAVEVVHTGGHVVRYGELTGKKAPNVSTNQSVNAGQVLGYIGTVNSGCCEPMLHFELYSGKAKGSLSDFSNRPFQRRSDLMNPTDYLSRWENKKFGASY